MTARKLAEERSELVARELGHRIANIFAVVNSIVRLAARSEPQNREFASRLEQRFAALHRAHAFVGRTKDGPRGGILRLMADLVAPYQDAAERVRISGDDTSTGPQTATSLALIVHEMATNSVKYGALSSAAGTVSIRVSCDEELVRVLGSETGGPAITARPTRTGFGSSMIDRAAKSIMGCAIEYVWKAEGLAVSLSVQRKGLER